MIHNDVEDDLDKLRLIKTCFEIKRKKNDFLKKSLNQRHFWIGLTINEFSFHFNQKTFIFWVLNYEFFPLFLGSNTLSILKKYEFSIYYKIVFSIHCTLYKQK